MSSNLFDFVEIYYSYFLKNNLKQSSIFFIYFWFERDLFTSLFLHYGIICNDRNERKYKCVWILSFQQNENAIENKNRQNQIYLELKLQ